MRIITAQEALQRPTCSHVLVLGAAGAGKTFLARTLHDQSTTVFVAMEAGTRALQGRVTVDGRTFEPFSGSMIEQPRTWDEVRAIGLMIGGPDPNRLPNQPYGEQEFQQVLAKYPQEHAAIEAATTLYNDSLTELVRICWAWVIRQDRAYDKKGQLDHWAAYRLLGDEVTYWLKQVQRRRDKNIIFAGILDKLGDGSFEVQAPGNVVPRELPGIFDTIVSVVNMVATDQGCLLADGMPADWPRFRALVCHQQNPFGLPAKDRSSRLALLEPPDLGALLAKMNAPE